MTLDDRISIEKGLDQHLSLRSIALQLGKDPTTISKEIKKHRSFQEHNRFNEPANKCALVEITVCIPPTVLQISQLVSNR